MSTAVKTRKQYDESSIGVLEGLEAVRVRPSMYIGTTDKKGLHHLVWEIVDNCVDEYLNGYADEIKVTLHKPGDSVTVVDNGRGIPVGIHPKYKKPTLEIILCTLHSGAKFGDGEDYIHSGGLHGVGSSVVNALSRKLTANIKRDGYEYQQTFKRGKPAGGLEKVGPFRGHGTTITFEPDPDIFKVTHFDPQWIKEHLEDMAYIHQGLKISFANELTGEKFDLSHPGGIPEFLGRLVSEGQKPVVHPTHLHIVKEGQEKMEVALQWTEGTDEQFRSYVNGIRTTDGGTHEAGLKGGIVKAIRNFMETHEVKTKGVQITYIDTNLLVTTVNMSGGPLTLMPGTYVVTTVEFDSTVQIAQTNTIFTPGTTWVNWPTSPLGGWGNNEDFGVPAFNKPYVIRPNLNCNSTATQNVSVCFGGSYTIGSNTYTASGTYTDTLANSFGCDSIVTTNLTVDAAIDVTTTTVTYTITANQNGATYQWIDCNNANAPIAGETNQSYTATQDGSYAVIVTVGACSDTSACEVIIGMGISSASSEGAVSMYPNPNNGSFVVSSTVDGQFTIVNAVGQEIMKFELNQANNYRVNVNNLGAGVYIMSGYSNGKFVSQRFVVNEK